MKKVKSCIAFLVMALPIALLASWTGYCDYLEPQGGNGEAEYTIDGSTFIGSSMLESPNWSGTATRRLQSTLRGGGTNISDETFYNTDSVSQTFGANDFGVSEIIGDITLIDGIAYVYGNS